MEEIEGGYGGGGGVSEKGIGFKESGEEQYKIEVSKCDREAVGVGWKAKG